jgi:hypothetical protein
MAHLFFHLLALPLLDWATLSFVTLKVDMKDAGSWPFDR